MGTETVQTPNSMQADFSAVGSTFGGGAIDDPYPIFRELRRTTPVMQGDILARYGVPSQADYQNSGRRIFTLFRHDDISRVLLDPENFTCRLMNEGQSVFWGENIWTADDGPPHQTMRGLMQSAFAPSKLKHWRTDVIDPIIRNEFAAPLAPRRKADLVADFALHFPVRAIYKFLGFPDDPKAQEQFATWSLRILGGAQVDPEKAKIAGPLAFQAARDLYDHIIKIIAARRASTTKSDDFIGHLLRAETGGAELSDARITSLVRLMLPAAAETTTRTFTNMMLLLLERPQMLARLRDDRRLVQGAINEAMRFEPTAAFLARLVENDTVIRGVFIPAGSAVSMATGSANRDEDVYPDSETFDIERAMKPNFGFGYGVHMCIGMLVARMELEAALNAVLDLMPNIRLDPDHPKPKIVGMTLRGPERLHVLWD
jgi:cytochrome P450